MVIPVFQMPSVQNLPSATRFSFANSLNTLEQQAGWQYNLIPSAKRPETKSGYVAEFLDAIQKFYGAEGNGEPLAKFRNAYNGFPTTEQIKEPAFEQFKVLMAGNKDILTPILRERKNLYTEEMMHQLYSVGM